MKEFEPIPGIIHQAPFNISQDATIAQTLAEVRNFHIYSQRKRDAYIRWSDRGVFIDPITNKHLKCDEDMALLKKDPALLAETVRIGKRLEVKTPNSSFVELEDKKIISKEYPWI